MGLEPGATYTLTLTHENDEDDSGALGTAQTGDVQTDDVRADAQGDLSYATQLDTPGRWRLNVQGADLDARFEVEVTSSRPSPTVTPPAVPDEAPATETSPTEAPTTETPPTETPATPAIETESTPQPEQSPSSTSENETAEEQSEPTETPTPAEDAPRGDLQDDPEDSATSRALPLRPTPLRPTPQRLKNFL